MSAKNWVIPLMLLVGIIFGCSYTTKDYSFVVSTKTAGGFRYEAALIGSYHDVSSDITIKGSPYHLIVWLYPGNTAPSIELIELYTKSERVFFQERPHGDIVAMESSTKEEALTFLIEKLELTHQDYRLDLTLENGEKISMPITARFSEKTSSKIWDAFSSI